MANFYNGIGGDIPVVSTSPVLAGVTQLFYDNGNSISASGSAQVITSDGPDGLIGTYSSSVPDNSSTVLLAGMSVALIGFGARQSRLTPALQKA
jgi:hypothetical protein